MDWRPLTHDELQSILERELAECSDEQRGYFKTVAFEPVKWSQSPYGDEGGGFWAVAAEDNRVLWYNDIEDGFNVSTPYRVERYPGQRILVQSGRAEARLAGFDGPSSVEDRASRAARSRLKTGRPA